MYSRRAIGNCNAPAGECEVGAPQGARQRSIATHARCGNAPNLTAFCTEHNRPGRWSPHRIAGRPTEFLRDFHSIAPLPSSSERACRPSWKWRGVGMEPHRFDEWPPGVDFALGTADSAFSVLAVRTKARKPCEPAARNRFPGKYQVGAKRASPDLTAGATQNSASDGQVLAGG
jgi:hypothetical protein